jgi:murein L,D-transpeptidase YcbB/YkuD
MRLLRNLVLITTALVALLATTPTAEQFDVVDFSRRQTTEKIASLLNHYRGDPGLRVGVARLLTNEMLVPFYAQREFQPLWQTELGLHPAARQLVEHLRGAAEHGLCSDAYLLRELEGMLELHDRLVRQNLSPAPFNQAILDLFLTQSFLTYATHLVEGQVDPTLTHVDWRARRRKVDLPKLLDYALQNDRLEQVLAGFFPPHEGYRALVAALASYREIAARGGWPVIPDGSSLHLGDLDNRVPLLKNRLAMTGDGEEGAMQGEPVYGQAEQAAVRHFQARHGLVADGVVGRETLEVLNVPVEQRIRQMELNLERWRWMPKSLGVRHIRINIAAFSLDVMEEGQSVLNMPVVVGTAYRKTPVFSARMTYLEFAPTWTVPPTILREDKLPAIKADPGYIAKKHFRVLQRQNNEWVEMDASLIEWTGMRAENFPGILRQDPGPWNPLGRVKFMFPNSFNVYLHDTNERQLFEKARRSFSSGCIRVEKPVELAQYLLKNVDGWDSRRLAAALQSTVSSRVDIPPLPVHIQYWTAWVDADGTVQFRPDLYFRDLDLEVALSEPDYQVETNLDVARSQQEGRERHL